MSAQEIDRLGAVLGLLRESGYRFVTPTPATIARVNARPGNEVATDLAGALGWSRPFELDLLPVRLRDLMQGAGLLTQTGDRWRSTIRVSSLGDDLYVHSAYPTVEPDAVFFGPDTYRFVSALRAELAARRAPVGRAVDIGCGAGPGGIVVAQMRPSADVSLVDINAKALLYAEANAAAAGIRNVSAVESDLLDALDGPFDLIVSNPPYLNDPLARAYRHGGGVFGEALSARIVHTALERLAPGGRLLLYTGVAIVNRTDPFLDAIAGDLRRPGFVWTYREIDPDVFGEELETETYAGVDRIAAVLLTLIRER